MDVQILVLHVKKGYELREQHIKKMLARFNRPFKFILDGDIEDLTPEWIKAHFNESMQCREPWIISCSSKHLLAMKHVVDNKLNGALILEDDISLNNRFNEIFDATMNELPSWGNQPIIISYEDTRLRFVEHSRKRKGIYLYEGDRDRMAGAYYVNQKAAKVILDFANTKRLSEPIDITHSQLLKQNLIKYVWCDPTIATRGRFSGEFRSSLRLNRRNRAAIKWFIKKAYRKLLYRLR